MLDFFFKEIPEARAFYKGVLNRIFQLLYRGEGVKIMEEDWENLIVLDACRYDFFEKYNQIDGRLRKRISLASHTEEWIHKNFGGEYPDTIYISGTPQASEVKFRERLGKNPFFHVEEVWDYGWDEENQLLPPDPVTEAALELREKHLDKRMIIHYMQPHQPFPTSTGLNSNKINSIKFESSSGGLLWRIMRFLARKYPGADLALKRKKRGVKDIWDCLRHGYLSPEEVKAGYVKNVCLILEEAKKLVKELHGRTIITADHGNLFGRYCIYGHPPRLRFKGLVEVPWLEVED